MTHALSRAVSQRLPLHPSIAMSRAHERSELRTQQLPWADVARASWSGHGTGAVELAAAASDNWQVSIEGTTNGKPMTIVLTGPSVEQQARVRELLAERLPES